MTNMQGERPSPSGYLDAAATAPLRPEARKAMLAALDAGSANPSSVHGPGHYAKQQVDDARESLARSFQARPSEVTFTSGGTEANNLAIIGLSLAQPRGRHIITTPIEHPSVLETCRYLERVFGFDVDVLPVDSRGLVSRIDVERALRDDTTLVSIGLANAEVGTVQPILEIGSLVKPRGALMHTDAVQAASSLPASFAGAGGWPGSLVDAMTIASHKFGGPQGMGALLVRRHLPIEPILHGGGQERGARSGTENVAGIVGFAAAVEATYSEVGSRAEALMHSRDKLIDRVTTEIRGASLTGHPSERLPGHASFVIEGVSGESILVALDSAGFAVSSGSACAAGQDDPSPALLAMGIDPLLAQTAVRFTLPAPLSDAQLNRIVAVLDSEVRSLRR